MATNIRTGSEAFQDEYIASPLEIVESQKREKHPPTLTISKSPEEVFAFLSNFANYPNFMKGLVAVERISETKWHWVVDGKSDTLDEWNIQITSEHRKDRFAWKTTEEGMLEQRGEIVVRTVEGVQGTVVSMKLEYVNPVRKFAAAFEKLVGKDPETQAHVNLRRLKAYLEAGEVPTTEGQPSGREEDLK